MTVTDLKYKRFGNGREIIITSMVTSNPKRFISLLAKDFTVYDVSLRRKGFPLKPSGELKNTVLTTWAEDIYRFALSLKIKKFYYMGISHGGLVGWNLASLYPHCLKGFISISGVPQDRNPSRLNLGNEDSMAGSGVLDKLIVSTTDKEYRKKIIASMQEEFGLLSEAPNPGLAWPECKTNQELADKFNKIKVPVLIIQGIQDYTINPDVPFIATQSVKGAKSVYFQDAGHFIATENPDKVVDEIKLFIYQLGINKKSHRSIK